MMVIEAASKVTLEYSLLHTRGRVKWIMTLGLLMR